MSDHALTVPTSAARDAETIYAPLSARVPVFVHAPSFAVGTIRTPLSRSELLRLRIAAARKTNRPSPLWG